MNASDFSQTNNCSAPLTPGSSCVANVIFTPSSPDAKVATLKIESDDPDEGIVNVALSGTGGTPNILARRVILSENFSSWPPAAWTDEDAWGTGCGRVIESPFVAPWAIVDPLCGSVSDELLHTPIFDASSCTELALVFSNRFSHGTGTTGTISVTDNYGKAWTDVLTMSADEGPGWKEVDLGGASGEGTQIEFAYSTSGGFWAIDNVWVLCGPPGFSFKAIENTTSQGQILMITNTGAVDLRINSVNLAGTDAAQFLILGDNCTGQPVAPSESCELEVGFAPGSTGEKTAKLSISSDDSDHPTLEVGLSGRGVLLLVAPEQGTFGSELIIMGSGFGEKKGKVLIGGAALKVTEWKPDSIKGLLSKVVSLGSCEVVVQTKQKGAAPISETDAFSVEVPKIWRVVPDHGVVNAPVTITGEYFGTKKGKVTIGGKSCKVTSWTMQPMTGRSTIEFLVPKGLAPATTYPIKVINKVGEGTDSFTTG